MYEFGRFQLDPDERVLLKDGEPVPMGPKVIDTLIVLVERAGHIIDKDQLINRVWPDSFVEDGSLTKNISLLRRVLGDGSANEFIENVPRRGYRFNALVRETRDEDSEIVIARRARLKIVTEGEDDPQSPQSIAAQMEISGMTRRLRELKAASQSLAVLPLRPLDSGDQESFLGLGIADALITRLSNLHEVIVRPTSAVVNYATPGTDSVEAGRHLRVRSVLEGSFRRMGDTLRVTVQLVSVEDEAPFWAQKFDVRFTDVFAVEDSISEQVVRALSLTLTRAEQTLLTKRFTQNTEAYEAYMKGRYFWNARTGEWMQKALGHFQEAISIDPKYALAHAGLADCYNTLGFWSYVAPGDSFPVAKAAASRALELDEGLAEAHAALAFCLLNYDWDFAGAEREFKKAIELNPGYALARLWYSMSLGLASRFDEALAEIERAREIDPLSLILNTDIGILLLLTRRYDEAIAQFKKTLELGPGFFWASEYLGYTYGLQGSPDKCIAQYQENFDRGGRSSFSLASLGFGHAMVGRRDEALMLARESKELHGDAYFAPHYFAQLYATLGEADNAFEWLEHTFEERSPWIAWLGVNPSWDGLRSDSRFKDVLRRAGLSPGSS